MTEMRMSQCHYILIHILLFSISSVFTELATDEHDIGKRQSSLLMPLSDLIGTAVGFLRTTFEPALLPLDSERISEKVPVSRPESREKAILGAPIYVPESESSICKSNSRLCKFIACTAHNFKNDESFSNINLAAQVLADKKLRKVVSTNPEAVIEICREQGLSNAQCRLFARGFQLIDKFISTIEPQEAQSSREGLKAKLSATMDPYSAEVDAPPVPIDTVSDGKQLAQGSRTWSSHPLPIDVDERTSSTSATLPPPSFTFPPFPSLFSPLTFPTLPTLPPFVMFPNLPFGLPSIPFKASESSNHVSFDKTNSIQPPKLHGVGTFFSSDIPNAQLFSERAIFLDDILYENMDAPFRKRRSTDYYDNVEEESKENARTMVENDIEHSITTPADVTDDESWLNVNNRHGGEKLNCLQYFE
ncbi:hypothetical protein AB6A40_000577 [Gnathostoma spinigerum]|uniref:Uncharacterized protein n=1 Tax=Gnathostoma spinigerum TaxID=75299 RepID=A0ABD6E2D7_9BILA